MIKPRNQSGFSLTEALVAFAVIAIGLLAVASFQSGLFKRSAYNKAQTEALALAQQKIEHLKHYTLADEEAYIDEDGDGVMDTDGNYTDDPITGRNAVYQRSWELGSTNLGRQVEVTVAWSDAENELQEVSLSADIPWISPRTAADQLVELVDPLLVSPTGRARLGEGHLSDIPSGELNPYTNIYPEDGLEIYQHKENLLLANAEGDILLTLIDACLAETGTCTDFVRIAGTVYLDTANTRMEIEEIELLASDAAFCKRWVPEGSLTNPPETPSGDYEYYHYTCYLGGGWHGNLGFVTARGLSLNDKVCQGDPTALEEEWKRPVIALRRAYRGMLSKQVNGETKYYSHGIRDAALLTRQDYVFTSLEVDATEGYHCSEVNAPMTRFDSGSGKLFRGVPTDFVCLNLDEDGDGSPDHLDVFDDSEFSAATTCPFDPTSPPVLSHRISGRIDINSSVSLDLRDFEVLTSDGPGNCVVEPVSEGSGTYSLAYACTVFDWGSGWTGEVRIKPNSQWVFCPSPISPFSALESDATQNNSCIGGPTITIEGPINYLVKDASIQSITIEEAVTGYQGLCEFIATQFRCTAPYDGSSWSGTLSVDTDEHVCDSTGNQFDLGPLNMDDSPYSGRLTIAKNQPNCPILEGSL